METRRFGNLGEISALTLGGGGIGQVWGITSREEAVATVRAAAASGITFLDLAPTYGDGEAESVVGEAFDGALPKEVRVSTKCRLGNPPSDQVFALLEQSLTDSLARMKLDKVDLFFLHSQVIPAGAEDRYDGTPRTLFSESVAPAFQRLAASGRIGAWGITGIGVPQAILETIDDDPHPAAIQAIANLLDSPGGVEAVRGASAAQGNYRRRPGPGHGGDGHPGGASGRVDFQPGPTVAQPRGGVRLSPAEFKSKVSILASDAPDPD